MSSDLYFANSSIRIIDKERIKQDWHKTDKMANAEVQGSMADTIGEVDLEVKVLEQEGKEMENLSKETEAAIEMLSTGVLSAFVPEMDNMKERIRELTKNQGVLIETMQQENAKFGESQEAKALLEIISQVKGYHSKLNRIHMEMEQINERVARLKRRANRLKLQKEKEEKNKLDAKKREQEIERQLIAKPATDQKSIEK